MIRLFRRKKKGALPDLWRNSPEFERLYMEIKHKTLVTKDRCFAIYQWARYASQLSGEFAEVGVYRGGTARLIARTVPQKTFMLFDTFAGMPKVDQRHDLHKEGDFNDTSLTAVQGLLSDCPSVKFIQGLFPQTAQGLGQNQFSLVHIDVDIYQSVLDGLHFFYPKMVRGGVMIFDDYEWKDCPGVKQAIDEFLKEKREIPVVSALYQCMILKL